jgi:carbonic anhydrase
MTNPCADGKFQSPINIKSKIAIKCGALCDLVFYYRTSKANLINVGKNIIMDYDNGSYIMYNNEVYELDKLSFTVPASHKLDNYAFPMEMHLNHRSPDTGKLLIIAILFEINDATSKSNLFLDMITNSLPQKKGIQKNVNTPEEWNIFNVLPEIKSFYSYTGSLPRSPCVENVQWVIFDNTVNCSVNFYEKLKNIIKGNVRSLQKLNSRKIYYNTNSAEKNGRNYGNRLRCYTEEQFRKSCSCLTGQKDIVSAKNKQVLLLTIVVILVVLFVLLIFYLIQEGFFKKTFGYFTNFMSSKLFLPRVGNK